jgi:CRISPR-associated protein Cas1
MAIVQHLVVDLFGAHIGKHSERLQVTQKGTVVMQAPLLHLEAVIVANQGVSLSAEMVRECTERGIPIHFVSGTGTAYASLYSAGLTGTVQTRRAQLRAVEQRIGLVAACAFAQGKVKNQQQLLKYVGKYRKESDPALFASLQERIASLQAQLVALQLLERRADEAATVDSVRESLLGHEGHAATIYWGAVAALVPSELGWPGRVGRGAQDAFNSGLNYGYGILYGQVERALVLAGLDPFAGFIHVDRPGKPSLTLDLIEEFRQAVVDRTLIGMVNKGVMLGQQPEDGLLTKETRRFLATKVLERLESTEPYEGKRMPLRVILQNQARHLATFLRGEREQYLPFVASW